MAESRYKLIPLRQANRYAGYQFWGRMRMDGLEGIDVFNYLVLSVYKWLLEKVPDEDKKAEQLQVPVPEDYALVTEKTFLPHHTNVLFDLDITPVPEEKIWALRIRQADHGTEGPDGRDPVIGRTFTTRVGVRLNEKGQTELAIKIDVTDPATEEKELEYAFRPGFVRTLAEQSNVHFEQITELKYGKPFLVESEDDYKQLLFVLDNDENQMPLAVFTYAHPGEINETAKLTMEEFAKKGGLDSLLTPGGLQTPVRGMGMPGMAQMPGAVPVKKKETPILPYNVKEYCERDTFAFALTYVLGDKFTERFRNRIKKEFRPGDILLCGAKKFRGGVSVFTYPGENKKELEKTYKEAVLAAQMYPKHKAPYDYGITVFEAKARDIEREIRINEIISSNEIKGKKETDELRSKITDLFKANEQQEKRIRQLEGEKNEAFDRGVAVGNGEIEKLKDEITDLKGERNSRQALIDHMQNSFQQVEQLNETLKKAQTIEALPQTNEDVVEYFLKVYGNRIDFTERGVSSASKCDIKPEKVWDILYRIAVPMVDLFRSMPVSPSEKDIAEKAGFDMSFREGSETREREEFMCYRRDQYKGEEILFEPHLKFRAGKSEADYQRLHFWYDQEMQRIVISYLGDHLPSYSSRFAK